MRGGDLRSEALLSYLSCEARVPLDHPLRPIQKIVDEALGALTGEFEKLFPGLRTETSMVDTDASTSLHPLGAFLSEASGAVQARLHRDKVLLAPYPSDEMICWPVSARVGNVKNNDMTRPSSSRSPRRNQNSGEDFIARWGLTLDQLGAE